MRKSLVLVVAVGVVVLAALAFLGGHPPGDSATASQPNQSAASSTPSTVPAHSAALPSRQPVVPALARISASHDGGLVFVFGSLWVGGQGGVERIDPATNAPSATIGVDSAINRLWADDSAVYAQTDVADVRIDPATNSARALGAAGMPAFGSIWWVTAAGDLVRLDPATGEETGRVTVQGHVDWQPQLASGFGSIWIASGDSHQLIRVDPSGPTVAATITGLSSDYSLWSVGIGFGSVWVQASAAPPSGQLFRVDPATNKLIATIAVGDPAKGGQYGGTIVAIGPDAVWTSDASPTVSRIDPKTNQLVAAEHVDLGPTEWIAVGAGSVWIRNQNQSVIERLDAAAWATP
jgi:hypothetical protein